MDREETKMDYLFMGPLLKWDKEIADNRVGSKGLVPLLSSHTTVRAVRHTAVC